MATIYMLTIPRTVPKAAIKRMITANDCKRWTVGFERGRNGYEHYQVRLETSNQNFFAWTKAHIPNAHVEQATDNWTYERKEGRFISSEDTAEIRRVRFGKLNQAQEAIIRAVRGQNDRQVDVWYDPSGNHGKSWLTVHLWETGQALVVPRASATAEKLSAFICSAWQGEPYIIIDIPRASKPTVALYETIEEIKDGLVFDHRYSGKTRNIRGTKIIVFTNTKLDTKKLSYDRWRLHGFGQEDGGREDRSS